MWEYLPEARADLARRTIVEDDSYAIECILDGVESFGCEGVHEDRSDDLLYTGEEILILSNGV